MAISDFCMINKKGLKIRPGDDLPPLTAEDIESGAQTIAAYEWSSDGKIVFIRRDKQLVRSLIPSPDGDSVIVLQSEEVGGCDNIITLNAGGNMVFRLRNPYPDTEKYREGDRCSFYSIKIIDDKLIAKIKVEGEIPGRPYKRTPTYKAIFQLRTFELIECKWMDSRAA